MIVIDTTPLWTGRLAKKVIGMKAMPAKVAVFESVHKFLYIKTLEGYVPVDMSCLICVGVAGEPWQQKPEKVDNDYFRVGADGPWTLYEPKDDKIVEFIEVTEELIKTLNIPPDTPSYIVGKWGETLGATENLQRFRLGDFIARRPADPSDQWVIAKDVWNLSYVEVESG